MKRPAGKIAATLAAITLFAAIGLLWMGTSRSTAASQAAGADSVGLNINNTDWGNTKPIPPEALRMIVSSGAGWVRLTAHWVTIENSEGAFDWSQTDQAVSALQQRHINVLLDVGGPTPCWATHGGAGGNACLMSRKGPNGWKTNWEVPDVAPWRNFVAAAAKRYAGRVTYFEIWNEPNWSRFLNVPGGARDQNVQLNAYRDNVLIPAADAIHASSPNARVVGPVTMPSRSVSPEEFGRGLTTVLTGPAANKIDVVSIHFYPPSDPVAVGQAARAAMAAAGMAHHQLWVTETGLQAAAGSDNVDAGALEAQRRYLVDCLTLTTAKGNHLYDKIFWFSLTDPGISLPNGKFGIVDRDNWSPRPAFEALQSFTGAAAPQ